MIKRDDLIHPIISGNKWRKLKYNIKQAKANNKSIVSFGGAYSNHIHALAFACYQEKINAIGIIRGEKEYADNFTLRWAKHWGMTLQFINRKMYQQRHNRDYLTSLAAIYPNSVIVPEGGSNQEALVGVGEIIEELNQQCQFDTLMTPVGSGGTFSGLIHADNGQHQLLGVSVLKESLLDESIQQPLNNSPHNLSNRIEELLTQQSNTPERLKPITTIAKTKNFNNWQLLSQFHRGGYAKFTQEDCQRIIEFNQITQLNFEPVYSGKMLLALLDLINQGYFPAHHRIVLLHTGGLQGLGGLAERHLIKTEQWQLPPEAPVDNLHYIT